MSCSSLNLTCLNGGNCIGNSCYCPNECYFGDQCQFHFNVLELPMTSAMLQDTATAQIIYVFIFILVATIGLLNNILSLITFIREPIRITICGIYLIIFCSCNIILMLLVYTNIITILHYDNNIYRQWNCFALSYICITFAYIYIWMSVAIIIEKVLIECFNFGMYGSRLRAIIISILIILFVGVSNLPEIYARDIGHDLFNRTICTYNEMKHHLWYRAQYIISYFHVIIPCIAHLVSIICILTTIARRKIFINGCNRSSKKLTIYRIWIEQLYIHRDFFIPPFSIIICILPHAIIHYILLCKCMKSGGMVLIRLHIVLVLLLNVPAMLTFVIYVCPDKLYLKEFKQTIIYRRFCCGKGKNNEQRIRRLSTARLTDTNENGW